MLKKIFALLIAVVAVSVVNFSTVSASNSVVVQSGSAWVDGASNSFGATVNINGTGYIAIAYHAEENSNYGWDIFQMMDNDGDWTYIGIKGDRANEFSFNNQLQVDVFVAVERAAAQTMGRTQLFETE